MPFLLFNVRLPDRYTPLDPAQLSLSYRWRGRAKLEIEIEIDGRWDKCNLITILQAAVPRPFCSSTSNYAFSIYPRTSLKVQGSIHNSIHKTTGKLREPIPIPLPFLFFREPEPSSILGYVRGVSAHSYIPILLHCYTPTFRDSHLDYVPRSDSCVRWSMFLDRLL